MKKMYLTALTLMAIVAINAQVLNPSFENWTTGNPDDWTTNNDASLIGDVTGNSGATVIPAVETPTGQTGTNGNSYIKLTSFNMANSTDATNFPNGDYGAYAVQSFNSTEKFASFSFDVKHNLMSNDTAAIIIKAFDPVGGLVGYAKETYTSISPFTTSIINMSYIGSVSSYTISISSSEKQIDQFATTTIIPGSTIEVDNITVGPVLPDPPAITNFVASDISNNNNGTDLEITFDVPDETNIEYYYAVTVASNVDLNLLANPEGFIFGNGNLIQKNGTSQTYNFAATDKYWKINSAGNALESLPIENNVEFIVYTIIKGTSGYDNLIVASNPITLTSIVSVTKHHKEVIIYPNPASDFVNFKIDGMEHGTIIINSAIGQEVINTTIQNGKKQIDLSSLKNGVYIYTVHNQKGEILKTNKLVVRK